MQPRIGISSNFREDVQAPYRPQLYLDAVYLDAVFAGGGIPYPLPVPAAYDQARLDSILAGLDGLLLSGGFDLHPRHFGEPPHPHSTLLHARRDEFELDLFRRAYATRIPILAICLGHQVAQVAFGGPVIQHVDDVKLTPRVTHYLPHDANAFHRVKIEPDSRLAQVVGATSIEVNSRHHQIVDHTRPVRELRPVAFAPDGVIEAYEDCDHRFLLSVQWHPEDLIDRPEHLRLFQALVAAARDRQRSAASTATSRNAGASLNHL